jgi:hypothetical protein
MGQVAKQKNNERVSRRGNLDRGEVGSEDAGDVGESYSQGSVQGEALACQVCPITCAWGLITAQDRPRLIMLVTPTVRK